VGASGDAERAAVAGGNREFDHAMPAWRDFHDPVGVIFGEPDVAVRTRRDPDGLAVLAGGCIFGDGAVHGADRGDMAVVVTVAVVLGEPQIAVGARGDAGRSAIGRGDEKFGDRAASRDLADLVITQFGEPDISVGARGNGGGLTAGGGK